MSENTLPTYGQARTGLNAQQILEEIERRGELTPAETDTLWELRAAAPQNQQSIGDMTARMRGMQRGATLGFSDDVAGAASWASGNGFQTGQQQSLEKDRAARVAHPDAFQTGELAGAGMTALGTLGAGTSALTGANMATKIISGGTAGGFFGAAQGQSDFEMDGSPQGQRIDYYRKPFLVGAGTGGLSYPAGRLVGAGINKARNLSMPSTVGYGAKPMNTLSRAFANTEDAGLDIKSYLDGVTEEAMLADVPGDLQGTAQGLAALRGTGGTHLANAINRRGDAMGDLIARDMDRFIDGPDAAFQARQSEAAARSSYWGPKYDAAINAEGALQIRPELNRMKQSAVEAGPDAARELNRFVADLEKKAENGLIDPAQLHWWRSDLSRALREGPAKESPLLKRALKDVDAVLDTVPSYKDARTGYANSFAMEDAIAQGERALRGGRATASSPREFQGMWDGFSEAQKDAFRKGMRRDIAGLMGTSRNDAAAAWGEFAKSWNEEKLRIVLGADADPLIKRLRSAKVFSETRGRVTAGSKTAEATEARDALQDYRNPESNLRPGPIARARQAGGNVVNDIADSLIYGNRTSNRNAELGEMLSLQGDARQALAAALLARSTAQRTPSPMSVRADMLMRALLAGGGGASTAEAN